MLAALRRHLWLAADLGARYLRVLPGGGGQPMAEADRTAVARLDAVASLALACGVTVLLETHDSHRSAFDALRVVSRVGAPSVGVLWDTLHTRLAGQEPEEALRALLPHLGYAQLKDVVDTADPVPAPLGSGVLRPERAVRALLACGYPGWLVWEYEALWYPQVAALPPLLPAARAWLREAVRDAGAAGRPRADARAAAGHRSATRTCP